MSWSKFFRAARQAKQDVTGLRYRGANAESSTASMSSTSSELGAARSDLVDFGSNDYLGLRSDPRILETLRESVEFGSGASPVLKGYCDAHRTLESELAKLHSQEDAMLFSSGYACNVGVISCLAGQNDLVFSDALNHASIIDGCRLSKAEVRIFPHNDANAIVDVLTKNRGEYQKVLIVTESVFSMDGDAGDLPGLADIARRFECGLLVDEAHATGVYGGNGSGLVEELGLQDSVLAKVGTLSKAVGAIGGYVVGSREIIEYLVNYCRSYIFSTSPPVPTVSAIARAIKLVEGMNEERKTLRGRSRLLRKELSECGWEVVSPESDSPIVPILTRDAQNTLALSAHLERAGYYVPAIRPPTVPEGKSRLRISLSARHTEEEIQGLLSALATAPAT